MFKACHGLTIVRFHLPHRSPDGCPGHHNGRCPAVIPNRQVQPRERASQRIG